MMATRGEQGALASPPRSFTLKRWVSLYYAHGGMASRITVEIFALLASSRRPAP
jgi:hypothetical protein